MENARKWYDNIVFNWVKNTDQSSKVFASASAFLMSITVYVIAQGFAKGFTYDVLWNWSSLIVGFAGGLGIPAVQEDGIRKAILKFLKNILFNTYREENIELSYELNNRDYQRYFVKKVNQDDLKDIKEDKLELYKKIIKDKMFPLEMKLEIIRKRRKFKRKRLEKKITKLQTKLDRMIKNGIDLTKKDLTRLGYEPMEIDDLFNFADNKKLKGRKRLIDDSVYIHRKANILARFYMPIIMMVLQGSALSVLKNNIGDVLIATLTFLLILIYVWYSSFTKQLELKEKIAIPSEFSKNTLLRQARDEYPSWQQELPKAIEVELVEPGVIKNTSDEEIDKGTVVTIKK